MIVDLSPPEPRESPRAWLLPAALAVVSLVILSRVDAPSPRLAREPVAAAPAPLLRARPPAPRELTLPAALGERVARGAGGVTGMPTAAVLETQETWWQFRLADGRDARLSRLPPNDAFLAPRGAQVSDVAVRGKNGRGAATERSATISWTEAGFAYQLSSRTLTVAELARLAEALVPE